MVCVCRSSYRPFHARLLAFCWKLEPPAIKSLKSSYPWNPPAGSSGSILKLHEDVQTCGYRDVQVMFDILTSELEASTQRPAVKHQHQQQQRKRRPPPPPWPSHRSSSVIAAAQ